MAVKRSGMLLMLEVTLFSISSRNFRPIHGERLQFHIIRVKKDPPTYLGIYPSVVEYTVPCVNLSPISPSLSPSPCCFVVTDAPSGPLQEMLWRRLVTPMTGT